MIIPNQTNLKVHYATVDKAPRLVACAVAKVQYVLFTVYPFIVDQFGQKGIQILSGTKPEDMPALIGAHSRHAIMDSGLFTLMFGGQAGEKSASFIERWQEALVDYVHRSGYNGTIVEVDCQKVLNVDAAWTFRERLRKALPQNRQINVFHIEDGYAGLDRLIEYTDYIAVSIPEMRILKRSPYNICKLVNYIKNKKPEIDIHLLGCTDLGLLKRLSFCSSSDSSSWTSGPRYGRIPTMSGPVHVDRFKASSYHDDYLVKVYDMIEEMKLEITFKSYDAIAIDAFAATQLKHVYAQAAGSQQ